MSNPTIPLLDLRAQYQALRVEILAAMERVADSQQFILGEEVRALEAEIASYCGVEFAIGCASGSDALRLALMAYDIGPGDAVLTVPYTFFATASAVHLTGATTVFVDVDERTFNMDVTQVADALERHPNIKAILPVHLFGGCADMDPLCALAASRGIPVIEDAAQSIGSEYKGRRAGSLGEIGCFSFFPSKNLGAFGDGGLCTTNDAALAEKLFALRVHGSKQKYFHKWVGLNSRLDTLQAAVLRVKLRHLDEWSTGRARNAELYRKLLQGSGVVCPAPAAYQTRHIYNQFVIRVNRRDELRAALTESGIGTEVYYPLPLHLQECFAYLRYQKGDFPVSEALARETLALPIYSELTDGNIQYVSDRVRVALTGGQKTKGPGEPRA
jgi:dTDP-4-amino-4,6-dideoxygalactose transaminase